MEENINLNNLFKEITTETGDHRDKVFQYLDLIEIPNYFYSCMFGELVKIFGIAMIEPDLFYGAAEYNLDEVKDSDYLRLLKTYSYKEQIDEAITCEGGTLGWYSAFKTTCRLTAREDLLTVYNSLNWMNSDYFDEYIGDHIIEEMFENSKEWHGNSSYSAFIRGKGLV